MVYVWEKLDKKVANLEKRACVDLRILESTRFEFRASHIRASIVASVVRWRATLLRTAFIAGGRRILSCAVLS